MSNLNNAHEGMDEMGDHLDAQQAKKAAAPQPVQTAEDERAAFETWWPGSGFTKFRDTARAAFQAGAEWKARAALASKPVPAGVSDEQLAEAGRIWVYSVGTGNGPDFAGMRAALAALPVREPMWQPIETAPKDGSMFLCWVFAETWSSVDGGGSGQAHDTSGVDFGWWRPPHPDGGDGYFVNTSGQMGDRQDITHWMPLPAAPGATAEPAPAREPSGTNWHAHHVAVNKAALQMVRNALRTDAEAGKAVRGEMLEELDKATFAIPAPAREPMTEEQAEAFRHEWRTNPVRESSPLVAGIRYAERHHGICKE